MALFTKTGKQGYRHTYAWEHSDGRTESTRDLTEQETDKIIKKLEAEFKEFDVANKMRRKLISMAREMGWEIAGKYAWEKPKADMDRVNAWCEKYGQFHKPLSKHTLQELPLLVTQFEQVYKSFLSS